jgi:hypothetical protein
MATNVRLLALVDLEGHVLAAQLSDQRNDAQNQDGPNAVGFEPLAGQRVISLEVPQEVMELPGSDLHLFLSDIKVNWPADIRLPELKVVKKTDHPTQKKDQ